MNYFWIAVTVVPWVTMLVFMARWLIIRITEAHNNSRGLSEEQEK